MGPITQFFVAALAASFLLQRYAPQYSLGFITTSSLLFLASSSALLTWRLVVYPRYFSPIRRVPSPPDANLILGHTLKILKEPTGKPAREWIQSVPNDGLIKYSMWGQDRLLPTNPRSLGEILVTKNYDFVKPETFRNGLARILGVGLLLAEGDEHRRQRRDLMPAFSFRHVKDLYPVFWNKSRELVECVSAAVKSSDAASSEKTSRPSEDEEKGSTADKVKHAPDAIEVTGWASRATLDIIGEAGMGKDFNALHDSENKLIRTYRVVFSPTKSGQILQLLGVFLPFWLLKRIPVKHNNNIDLASQYLKQLCRDMVAEKRKKMSEKGRTDFDIVSVAIESGGFTDEELSNQMMTFLAAGHETTATGMTWAVYFLCKHPDIQSKLRDEIRSKLPSLDSDISSFDIDSCQYLHAVCSEVFRLSPPATTTVRVAGVDTSINGQMVPKGTPIILSPSAINTSRELWGDDAMEFKPERWLDADGKANKQGGAESNFSYLTFLHGPRSCIGQRFAQAEFACLVAAWVGRFETRLEEGSPFETTEPDVTGGITAKPKGGLWVQLKELDGW